MVQTLTAIAWIDAVNDVDTLHPVVSTTLSLLDNGQGKKIRDQDIDANVHRHTL